jgi:hypothetical protein
MARVMADAMTQVVFGTKDANLSGSVVAYKILR